MESLKNRISVLNENIKRLNNERQMALGRYDTLKAQLDAAVKSYETNYGVALTAENIEAERQVVEAEINGKVQLLEGVLAKIAEGDYKNAEKLLGVTPTDSGANGGGEGTGGADTPVKGVEAEAKAAEPVVETVAEPVKEAIAEPPVAKEPVKVEPVKVEEPVAEPVTEAVAEPPVGAPPVPDLGLPPMPSVPVMPDLSYSAKRAESIPSDGEPVKGDGFDDIPAPPPAAPPTSGAKPLNFADFLNKQ